MASTLLDEGCVRAVGVKSVAAVRNAALGEQFLDDSTALYSFVGLISYAKLESLQTLTRKMCV